MLPPCSFDTFYQSLLTLVQIVGGENWVDIMRDTSRMTECTTTIDLPGPGMPGPSAVYPAPYPLSLLHTPAAALVL